MASFEEDMRYVQIVRVVAHTTGLRDPSIATSDNHWSIFLILANNEGSVRINMRAELEDPTGILDVTEHMYTDSNSRVASWDFRVNGSIPVAWFYRLIFALGRHRYNMSGGGSGCRWWV